MIHIIAAIIFGNRNKSGYKPKSHNNENKTEEPLRKDEKIIINIVYWVIILTIAFVIVCVKYLKVTLK